MYEFTRAREAENCVHPLTKDLHFLYNFVLFYLALDVTLRRERTVSETVSKELLRARADELKCNLLVNFLRS